MALLQAVDRIHTSLQKSTENPWRRKQCLSAWDLLKCLWSVTNVNQDINFTISPRLLGTKPSTKCCLVMLGTKPSTKHCLVQNQALLGTENQAPSAACYKNQAPSAAKWYKTKHQGLLGFGWINELKIYTRMNEEFTRFYFGKPTQKRIPTNHQASV